MRWRKVHLQAIGYRLPPVVVGSDELEELLAPVYRRLGVQPGQLQALTGVEERRFWEPGTSPVAGATDAAVEAVERSGVPAELVDTLIYGGVTRELFEPASACTVAAGLEEAGVGIAPTATLYDLSNACLGVLNGMVEIANRIELGQSRAGLVVASESAREIVEATTARLLREPSMPLFVRSLATFTGGSGAAAVLLTDGSFGPPLGTLVGAAARTAPRHHRLCRWGVEPAAGPVDGGDQVWLRPFMETDAPAVLEHGLDLAEATWQDFRADLGWSGPVLDRTVAHQVGARHRDAVLARLGLDPGRDVVSFPFLGNTGSVAVPLTLALAAERGTLQAGERIGLLGIGSGLNCLMLGLEWQGAGRAGS